MNHPRNDQIQQAINGWIGREWHWHRKMAVTLKILQYDNHGNPISEHAQDQSIRHFLKRLEATFYGSVLRKKGRRLQAFVVAETSQIHFRHFHLIIDSPHDLSLSQYRCRVDTCWRHVDLSITDLDVQEADDRWLVYITKFRTKPDYAGSFVWQLARRNL